MTYKQTIKYDGLRTIKAPHHPEHGGVLIWIFVTVALFGMLTYAATRMGDSGSKENKTEEVDRLMATDITQYSATVQRALRVMAIDGVLDTAICFDSDNWGHNDYEHTPACDNNDHRVFDGAGGAVKFQGGFADWFDSTTGVIDSGDWVYSARYEIDDVGTDSGTVNSAAANADLVMAIAPVRGFICEMINRNAGFANPAPPAVAAGTHDALAGAKFIGAYNGGLGRVGGLGRERCVLDGDGFHISALMLSLPRS